MKSEQKNAVIDDNVVKNDKSINDPTQQTFGLEDMKDMSDAFESNNIDFILDIPLEITVELGRTKMMICDLLKLCQGSVIELGKLAGDTLEILANKKLVAKGEVVVLNEKYGIRITEVISPVERIEKLK